MFGPFEKKNNSEHTFGLSTSSETPARNLCVVRFVRMKTPQPPPQLHEKPHEINNKCETMVWRGESSAKFWTVQKREVGEVQDGEGTWEGRVLGRGGRHPHKSWSHSRKSSPSAAEPSTLLTYSLLHQELLHGFVAMHPGSLGVILVLADSRRVMLERRVPRSWTMRCFARILTSRQFLQLQLLVSCAAVEVRCLPQPVILFGPRSGVLSIWHRFNLCSCRVSFLCPLVSE